MWRQTVQKPGARKTSPHSRKTRSQPASQQKGEEERLSSADSRGEAGGRERGIACVLRRRDADEERKKQTEAGRAAIGEGGRPGVLHAD